MNHEVFQFDWWNRHYSWSCVSDRHCSFESFQLGFFLWPRVISSQACHVLISPLLNTWGRPSAGLWRPHSVWFSQVLCPMNPSQTLSSVTSTQGVHHALPVFVLPAPWPGNSLKTVSLENQRAHPICFLFPRDHSPPLPDIQCLENHHCFMCFIHFGGWGGPGRVKIHSWPEIEGHWHFIIPNFHDQL